MTAGANVGDLSSTLEAYLFGRRGSIAVDRAQFTEALKVCTAIDRFEGQVAVWRLCAPTRAISRAIVHLEDEISVLRERLAVLVG